MAERDQNRKKRNRQESRWMSSDGWLTGWDFGNPRKQAQRDVRMFIRPQLNQIGRARQSAGRDYERYDNRIQNLYDIVGKNLAGIGSDMAGIYGNISGDYTSGSADILGALGQSTAPDQQAYLNSLGSQALAGQRMIGTMGNVALNTNQSYREQGELERLVAARNAAGELRDLQDDYRQQKLDVLGQRPDLLRQRLDELRQLAWERWMAEREWRLRAASVNGDDKGLSAFIESLYANLPPGRGGKKGGKKDEDRRPTNTGGGSTTGGPMK
jgi:hypothetical protein